MFIKQNIKNGIFTWIVNPLNQKKKRQLVFLESRDNGL